MPVAHGYPGQKVTEPVTRTSLTLATILDVSFQYTNAPEPGFSIDPQEAAWSRPRDTGTAPEGTGLNEPCHAAPWSQELQPEGLSVGQLSDIFLESQPLVFPRGTGAQNGLLQDIVSTCTHRAKLQSRLRVERTNEKVSCWPLLVSAPQWQVSLQVNSHFLEL